MKLRTVVRALAVGVSVVAGMVLVAPMSSAAVARAATVATFAEAGVDVGALRPGWTAAAPDRIEWDGGRTGYTILTTAVAAYGPCRSGYFCLFQHADQGGNMWYTNDINRIHNLAQYNFDNVTSSWRNLSAYSGRWYVNPGGSPNRSVCVRPTGGSDHPDEYNNDEASAVLLNTTC